MFNNADDRFSSKNKKQKRLSVFVGLTFFLSAFLPISHSFGSEKVTQILNRCETTVEINCIESVSITSPEGKVIEGKLTGRRGNHPISTNDAFLKNALGTPQEWNFDGLKFGNGNGKVFIFSYYFSKDFLHCWNDGNCSTNFEEFNIWVRPSDLDSFRKPITITGDAAKLGCQNATESCVLGSPPNLFDIDINFSLKVRLTSEFKAAYTFGRSKNYKIREISRNSLVSIYEINFSPLKLENVVYTVPDISVFPQGLYVTDEPAVWVGGKNNLNVRGLGACWNGDVPFSSPIKVMTNATIMGMPFWSATDSSIKVNLKAPHLATDGGINKGYLEVGVPVQQAKCMWGINLENSLAAKIEFSYADGKTEIVTATANKIDDYYQMVVAGFHYSAPTVGIKFVSASETMPKQTESTPAPNVKPSAQAIPTRVSKTITCFKGKVTKKVSGLNPKCPKGYTIKKT